MQYYRVVITYRDPKEDAPVDLLAEACDFRDMPFFFVKDAAGRKLWIHTDTIATIRLEAPQETPAIDHASDREEA